MLDAEQENRCFWFPSFVSSISTVYLFFNYLVWVIPSVWKSQNNITGTNIFGCIAQCKTRNSVSLLQKSSPDTCLGTLMCLQRCNRTEETDAHMQYWLWQLYATQSIVETLPLNSRASAKPSSVLPKPWSESSAISAPCLLPAPRQVRPGAPADESREQAGSCVHCHTWRQGSHQEEVRVTAC